MKRRSLLSTTLLSIVPLTGCLGDGQPVKLTARNFTEKSVEIDLCVLSANETELFEYSGTFRANQSYELADVAGPIDHIELAVDDTQTTHEYRPVFSRTCENRIMDIKITERDVDFDYLCASRYM
ncbi:hypothetical protein GJR96_14485 [Haloferax sp. MBLA0076]|uniref:Uncharacterized protein n=1 Tax=Haloferax litoreum TaxID=2666140 RepID=A0A6A8GJY2_9EURY|nr:MULTISPECIES: hypothetical protein [Haloferax]KAB1194583.1 hypothetical protein Hfx1148_14415 [Haloferax sp. CBA1148]MRX23159.1 hypothetical protein [Haloferax litoreum]